ncbi:MAG: MFS transporter [Proteobacteria bacterium]|nr:MFS transporter [Pseudomonadota bacterium]
MAWPLTSMLAIQALVSAAVLTVPIFAVVAAADLGVPARWVGAYIGLIYAGAMFSSVLGGVLVLRFGAVRVSQVCLLLAATSLSLTATAWLPAVVFSTLVMGIAYGPPTPASSHILARLTPERLMPLVFSIKQTGVPLGGALAGVIVPPLVLTYGWHRASIAVAALCVLTAIGLVPLRARLDADREPGRRLGANPMAPLRRVLADRSLRRLAYLSFLYSSVQMSFTAYLVTYLVEAVKLDLIVAGMIFATAQMAGVVGRVLWGALTGVAISARNMLVIIGFLSAAGALATASLAPDWPPGAIFAVAVLYGATAIGWNGVYLAEFARLCPPGQAGLLTGGSGFITFGGVMVTPPLFGAWVGFSGSYPSAFIILGVLAVLGAVLMLLTPVAGDRGQSGGV